MQIIHQEQQPCIMAGQFSFLRLHQDPLLCGHKFDSLNFGTSSLFFNLLDREQTPYTRDSFSLSLWSGMQNDGFFYFYFRQSFFFLIKRNLPHNFIAHFATQTSHLLFVCVMYVCRNLSDFIHFRLRISHFWKQMKPYFTFNTNIYFLSNLLPRKVYLRIVFVRNLQYLNKTNKQTKKLKRIK